MANDNIVCLKVEHYNVSFIRECEKTPANLLQLKSRGPPRPEIALSQICKVKNKSFTRYFRQDQYLITPWICGCDETNKLFCFPCLVFGGDDGNESSWCETGVDDLAHLAIKKKKHSSSQSHMICELQLASLGRQGIRSALNTRKSIKVYNERVDENRHILRRLIDCVVFCGAFQVALRRNEEYTDSQSSGIYTGLVDFVSEIDLAMKQHLSSNSVFKGTSKMIQNDILDAVYEVCRSEIREQIKNAEFVAIQADESTDCSTIQQLVLIVRYINEDKIYERFLKFIQPQNQTAKDIASEIINEIGSLNIDKNKLISQSYDGAPIMSGSANSVQDIVRKIYPNAYYVHCYAHPLNLILEKCASINPTVRSFFCNLHAFPSFFTNSPTRLEVLKAIMNQRAIAAPQIKWNYNTRTVKFIHDNLEPLKECIESIMDSHSGDPTTYNHAEMLLSYLNRDNFLYWLKFFAKLIPHCEKLFKILPSRTLDLNKIVNGVSKFDKAIDQLRDHVDLTVKEECDADGMDTVNELCDDGEPMIKEECRADEVDPLANTKDDGVDDDVKPPPPKKQCLPDNVNPLDKRQEVCNILREQIKDRLVNTHHLLASKLFYTDKFIEYNEVFPTEDFKKVVKIYDFLDHIKLKHELSVIYSMEDFYCADGAVALLQYFIELSLESVFSETIKLLKIVCTIPMISTESERCFTTLNKVKTFRRNTMAQERLNALCMISLEKGLINSISNFHNKVIEVFARQKHRRMDFLHK